MDKSAEYLIGPWLVCTCIALLFQGILSTQYANYFRKCRSDPVGLKLLVGILALLTYAKCIVLLMRVWSQLIENFGVQTSHTTDWTDLFIGTEGATIELGVQCYFCSRLVKISERWYLAAPIGTLFLFSYVAGIVGVYYLHQWPRHIPEVFLCYEMQVAAVLVGDLILTTSTAYFLIRSKKDVMPVTVGVLNALIRLTVQTGTPATIFAIINVGVALGFPERYSGSRAAAAAAVYAFLSSTYVFSMMWTLNERAVIRAAITCEVTADVSTDDDMHRATESMAQARTAVSRCDAYPKLHRNPPGQYAESLLSQSHSASSIVMVRRRSDDSSAQSEEMVFAHPRVKIQ
ncbi:hypothetical protein DFH09DRAFT_118363 [Mycena vulgaris]|nr:hypothetical protein DFH09DRAFT_118363 [Mycena vulgaris]